MGREVKRVPLDFIFPLDASYADASYAQHLAACKCADKEEHDYNSGPPRGDGWQLWQTVSDGPISPVFATASELIGWMSQPEPDTKRAGRLAGPWGQGWDKDTAERFVRGPGRAPSMVFSNGQLMSGVDFVTKTDGKENE